MRLMETGSRIMELLSVSFNIAEERFMFLLATACLFAISTKEQNPWFILVWTVVPEAPS